MSTWDRFSTLTIDEFSAMKILTVDAGVQIYSNGCKTILNEHLEMLEIEFSGLSHLLFYHTWLTVNIRREIEVEKNLKAFFLLWEMESSYLVKHLSLRWLVSACDTVIDYSKGSIEIATATSVVLLVNTIKLYETEELMMFNEFNVSYSTDVPETRIALFDGISAFRIGGGDMVKNMLHRVTKNSDKSTKTYPILMEVINRIHINNTIYKRMAQNHKSNKTRWWHNEQLLT